MQNNVMYNEFFPASLKSINNDKAFQRSCVYSSLINKIIHYQARKFVNGKDRKKISFSLVDSESKWNDTRELRLCAYRKTVPYMLNELKQDGSDHYDSRSLVFGAWYNGKAIASIRFTAWPFELCEYINHTELDKQLPQHRRHNYLELSRLLVSPNIPYRGVMPALIVFSGLNICFYTHYSHYTGFVKGKVFERLNTFMCSNTNYQFSIPSRGDHQYQLIKGDFATDFENVINKITPNYIQIGGLLRSLFFNKEK